MSGYPFSGPIAPESNPEIEPEWFQPSVFTITAISYGATTTVTNSSSFGVDNNYVIGQRVRLVIPYQYGSYQISGQEAYVISLPDTNQVELNINTSIGVDPFIPSPTYGPTPPQIVAIGDINSGVTNSSRTNNSTVIPGSFINISPSAGG